MRSFEEYCNVMAPDLVERMKSGADKARIEEAVARTEPHLKKKKHYYATKCDGMVGLNNFLYREGHEHNSFTVVAVTENQNHYYTVIYYEEE